jgi:hypothetical protein
MIRFDLMEWESSRTSLEDVERVADQALLVFAGTSDVFDAGAVPLTCFRDIGPSRRTSHRGAMWRPQPRVVPDKPLSASRYASC